MNNEAFQDRYPEELSHCYGCGKNNHEGHQLKSYWQNIDKNDLLASTTIARYTPSDVFTALPGFVYGGMTASLIDCHGTGSASAMAYLSQDREMGSSPILRFVTGALNVSFLAPTPQGVELELIGRFSEVKDRKITVDITLSANGVICSKGQVIAILMPESMMK
ncbi:MAG: thioesterase [Gammaproteobacteria bacterium]|jgi:acyl-coenzyme A thioesterase PaaI-like protein|nr:MAG: thioesterase [Gammaproteobacteria bacterium]PHR85423.1 MAG: thioesterase [Colwellia sp.]